MADQLKNIVRFLAIPPSAIVSLPHNLSVGRRQLVPDYIDSNPKGLSITADSVNVTVTNTTGVTTDVDVLVEAWSSLERVFGSITISALTPQPFVSGGSSAAPGPTGLFTGTNGDVVTLAAAMPVAQPTTTLKRATAGSGFALANVIGLIVIGAAIALPVKGLANGILQLATPLWDAVTGSSGGLVPGRRYYLDAILGRITTYPPTAYGQYVTVIGWAISADTLIVNPEPPILL